MLIKTISYAIFFFCMLATTNAYTWSPPISGNWQLLRGFDVLTHTCYGPYFNLNGSSPACDTYAIDFVPDKNFEGIDTQNWESMLGGIVMSVGAGTVIFAGEQNRYGKTVIIEHENNIYSRYSHLDSTYVKAEQDVLEYSFIGKSGGSGSGNGSYPHLHFAMYLKTPQGNIVAYKPKKLGGLSYWPKGQFSLNGSSPKLRSRGGKINCVINCDVFNSSVKKFNSIFPLINND